MNIFRFETGRVCVKQKQLGYPNTMNPLYNDIRYNSKLCYNVNLVCIKISGLCIFFIDSPMLFFKKTYFLDICKNCLDEAILTNTQNVLFIRKLFYALDGLMDPYPVSL